MEATQGLQPDCLGLCPVSMYQHFFGKITYFAQAYYKV